VSALLSAEDVSYYWRRRPLVDSVSLDIASGRVTAVVGPNGAGKSTLLRLLSGELQPTAGVVSLDGRNLDRITPTSLACQRAVMTQTIQLSFSFTTREVVRLGLDGIGAGLDTARRAEIVARTMETADVLALASRRYETLSGGEQRRVQFARALAQIEAGRSVTDRQALLLDEPVANLDLPHQLALLDAARAAAARGTAVLTILHDLNLATRYADTLALMHEGKIVGCGPPSVILSEGVLSDVFGVDLAVTDSLISKAALIFPSRWIG